MTDVRQTSVFKELTVFVTPIETGRVNVCVYKRDTVARSRDACCLGKAISVTYSECVSVSLVI
jgi:hypothetical protein